MNDEGRALELRGAASTRWIRTLVRALRAARLSSYWPDARRLAAHIDALDPEVHRGLYPTVEIDPRSGLPTYKAWTRVVTDRLVAADALAHMGDADAVEARAAERPETIHGKQLLKHHYYTALLERRLAPLSHMEVALRRVDPAAKKAWFHVVLDKLDASGLFVRYTIDLAQEGSAWSRPLVVLEEEHAQHTEGFRTQIYRFTSLDAEFTFVQLATIEGLEVERVIKGTVGPCWLRARDAPQPLRPMFRAGVDQSIDAFVATFGLDMAATDLAADKNNDPLAPMLADQLSDGAKSEYNQARRRFGYKVFKDRKLVLPRPLKDAARAWCRAAGTKNVIYHPRPPRRAQK